MMLCHRRLTANLTATRKDARVGGGRQDRKRRLYQPYIIPTQTRNQLCKGVISPGIVVFEECVGTPAHKPGIDVACRRVGQGSRYLLTQLVIFPTVGHDLAVIHVVSELKKAMIAIAPKESKTPR